MLHAYFPDATLDPRQYRSADEHIGLEPPNSTTTNYLEFQNWPSGGSNHDNRNAMPPARDITSTRIASGWGNSRDPDEWNTVLRDARGPSSAPTNQVDFLTYVARVWENDFNRCMGQTEWSKPFQDCIAQLHGDHSSDDPDAFKLCLMVTDGKPAADNWSWKVRFE